MPSILDRWGVNGLQLNSRFHASDTGMAPATALSPTPAEFQAFAIANSLANVFVYYTGTDVATDDVTYLYHADINGVTTPLIDPNLVGGGGGVEVYYSQMGIGPNVPGILNGVVDLDNPIASFRYTQSAQPGWVDTANNWLVVPAGYDGLYEASWHCTWHADNETLTNENITLNIFVDKGIDGNDNFSRRAQWDAGGDTDGMTGAVSMNLLQIMKAGDYFRFAVSNTTGAVGAWDITVKKVG